MDEDYEPPKHYDEKLRERLQDDLATLVIGFIVLIIIGIIIKTVIG